LGAPVIPRPVRPILGLLSRQPDLFTLAAERAAERWGAPDLESDLFDFTFTDYYAREMGGDLKRRFLSFAFPMDPADLAEVKLWTNRIEQEIAAARPGPFPRPINLDPGYLNDSKLVLASTKDHAHRIYLGAGIYAEITLSFHHGAWHPMPWTYPDYRTDCYLGFFQEARARYLRAKNA